MKRSTRVPHTTQMRSFLLFSLALFIIDHLSSLYHLLTLYHTHLQQGIHIFIVDRHVTTLRMFVCNKGCSDITDVEVTTGDRHITSVWSKHSCLKETRGFAHLMSILLKLMEYRSD